jgi:hypothetical protein
MLITLGILEAAFKHRLASDLSAMLQENTDMEENKKIKITITFFIIARGCLHFT